MKFKKKPVEIEAIQYTKELDDKMKYYFVYGRDIAKEIFNIVDINFFKSLFIDKDYNLFIKTLEGNMKVDIGDWIIKGIKGEYYPCKPDIFEKTYEKVE